MPAGSLRGYPAGSGDTRRRPTAVLARTAAAATPRSRAEKASGGARRNGRTELQVPLGFVQPGNTPVVNRVDRLARSLTDGSVQRLGGTETGAL